MKGEKGEPGGGYYDPRFGGVQGPQGPPGKPGLPVSSERNIRCIFQCREMKSTQKCQKLQSVERPPEVVSKTCQSPSSPILKKRNKHVYSLVQKQLWSL